MGEAALDTLQGPELRLRRCTTCSDEFPGDYLVCPRDSTPLGVEQGSDPLMGSVLGGAYRVVRPLGRGGMGKLYEAEHTRLDRKLAVKVLSEAHARSRDASLRFDREARALGRIRSEHVLAVMDVVRTPDDRAALITERLEGEDLRARLERVKRMPVAEAVTIARQVCRGLAAAHACGVVHRDLKPSNLFLESGPDGRVAVKILDFGVAKLQGDPELTRAGTVVGTPAYMAPEQARGSARADERADLYGVGAVLYRMLTGRAPYVGTDPSAMLGALLTEAPPKPRALQASIPAELEALVLRAMARAPEQRFASALELERALAAFDENAPAVETGWDPTTGEGNTLVLPRGTVERARASAQRAQRARPKAILCSAILALGAGGVAGLITTGIQGSPRDDVDTASAWLIACAVSLATATLLMRWLGRAWASAADVQRAAALLSRATVAGGAALGTLEILSRGWAALTSESDLTPSGLIVRGALYAGAALLGLALLKRSPQAH